MVLQTYLYAGMAVLFGIVIILGYLGSTKTNSMEDFAIAGANLGPYVLGSAFAATFFSAATFVGYVGWSYQMGLANIWKWLSLLAAGPIGLLVFAKRVRKANVHMRSVSLPDWLGAYYDSQIVRVGVGIAVLFNLFYIGAQLSAGALIFEELLGWEYEVGLAVITVVVTLYVMAGATYADVYTDAIQGALMALMGVVVFISVFWVFDWGALQTFPRLSAELEAVDPNLVAVINTESLLYYSPFAIGAIFFMDFAFAAQPQLFNKILSLKDPADLRKMIITYVFLTLCFILVLFAGFYMRILDPSLAAADQAIFVYVEQYFPPLVAAFLGVVVLAAALSTTDGLYIVISTAIANDIFLKFLVEEGYINIENERADRISRYIAQVSVMFIGAIAYIIVLNPPALLGELVWVAIGGIAAATIAPVIFGIYFPNFVTRKGAITSIFIGLGAYTVLAFLMDFQSVVVQSTYAVIISSSTMVVVSAVTRQEPGVASNHETKRAGVPSDD